MYIDLNLFISNLFIHNTVKPAYNRTIRYQNFFHCGQVLLHTGTAVWQTSLLHFLHSTATFITDYIKHNLK